MRQRQARQPVREPEPEDPGEPFQGAPISLDQLPPHSPEAEEGVLGCILLSPSDTIAKCITMLRPGGQVFYDLRNRTIYDQALSLWQADKPVDIITLNQRLRDTGLIEGVGGMSYLAALPDKVPSAANLDYYAEILIKKFTLREIIKASAEAIEDARKDPPEPAEVVARASAAVQSVVEISAGGQDASAARSLVPEAMDHIDRLITNSGKVVGISTGFSDLDVMTWGLEPTEVVILAARPGMGKTSLAMNVAEHVAINCKVPVGVFSMEMSKQSLMVRMLCSRARVDASDVRAGHVNDNNLTKLAKAATELIKAPLYIDDSSALNILELRARAKLMSQQYGVKLFVVDYIQLMTASVRRSDNRQHEVATISKGLKALAKDLKVPVLALSQLNRKLDDRGGNAPPKLSDLRESGSIEQDADKVILMHKRNKEITNPNGTYTANIAVTAIVAKNRNGPTGEVDLVFLRGFTRFENAAKASSHEDAEQQPSFDYDHEQGPQHTGACPVD